MYLGFLAFEISCFLSISDKINAVYGEIITLGTTNASVLKATKLASSIGEIV